MIDRQTAGDLPPKPHTVFRDADGRLLFEEMFTRNGFDGAFSYFYHRFPTTGAPEVRASKRGFRVPAADEPDNFPLQRRLYHSDRVAPGGMLVDARTPILFNADLTIYLARPTVSDDVFFANGDGDELHFIQEGDATLESPCGRLDVTAGDYVWVPRSLIHRWEIRSADVRSMVFELHGGMHIPHQFRSGVGQLLLDAPYTHRDFKRPVFSAASADHASPRLLVVKKGKRFSEYTLEHSPMDLVGWDGFVYPWAFPIDRYQPKTGLIHLPPTIHSTFAARGALICSFVPRVTDTHPTAIPCPYPHSSVDCDEVILYLRGNFTSRRGVGPGAISLHPAGIAHGPHPGAYEASIGTTRTDEMAVMLDCFLPLKTTRAAAELEDAGYHASWNHARISTPP